MFLLWKWMDYLIEQIFLVIDDEVEKRKWEKERGE